MRAKTQREIEAARLSRKHRLASYHAIARKAQDDEPSDPFVYGRTMAHLKSGAMRAADYAEKDNG